MAEFQHVDGFSHLSEALLSFAPKLRRKVLGGAVRAAAAVIRDEARDIAPVYTGKVGKDQPPPGTLKREIIYKRLPEFCDNEKEVYGVTVRRTRQKAYYWLMVEFGTSKMSARPYLRPAFERRQQAAIEAMRTELQVGVAQAGDL